MRLVWIKKLQRFAFLFPFLFSFLLLSTAVGQGGAAHAAAGAVQPALPLSSTAQRLYSSAKSDLLQLRILIRNGRAQSTVGSGFLIGKSNLVVTNYHVVSQIALEPESYVAEYADTNGRRGQVKLVAVDVLHDLAVVKIDRKGTGFFSIGDRPPLLRQGEYLYSLGNPLDLGFAISEGAYNGVISSGTNEKLMFTGPLNGGMSGGPCITAQGRVAGVNVSRRLDGESVSFLVPVRHVRELLKKAEALHTPPIDFSGVVAKQLLTHQSVMVDRLLAGPLNSKNLGKYRVPVLESNDVRCWGQSSRRPEQPYVSQQISCSMDSAVFVSDELETGHASIRHEVTRSTGLGALRFSSLATRAFQRESFGEHGERLLTDPACSEEFLANKSLSMRAVLCVRAYRKFSGLYDFSVLTATTDDNLVNLQSRLDAYGVSYENGLRVSRTFLESLAREKKR
jgi:S1-C subfamily serine protease